MAGIQELLQTTQAAIVDRKQSSDNVKESAENESVNFADTIKDFLTAVNNNQKEAGSKVTEFIEGKSENLAEAMATMQEGRLSFQLMLEIRNKLLESYREIQRMQV